MRYADTSSSSIDKYECLKLLESFANELNDSQKTLSSLYGLSTIGYDAYKKKDYPVAEISFRILSDFGDINAKNNYAYMIRRGEAKENPIKSLHLLREGVKQGEPFSFVNMALTLVLCYKSDNDWRIADNLIKVLPEYNTSSIQTWWDEVGKKGENEGFLVHFFLLRHDKIQHSNLGSINSIVRRLKNSIINFPAWLADGYVIETLDDVVEAIDDPDFDTILEDFLEKMPYSRKSVEEMLKTVSALDLWPVYKKLLTDCFTLLTPE